MARLPLLQDHTGNNPHHNPIKRVEEGLSSQYMYAISTPSHHRSLARTRRAVSILAWGVVTFMKNIIIIKKHFIYYKFVHEHSLKCLPDTLDTVFGLHVLHQPAVHTVVMMKFIDIGKRPGLCEEGMCMHGMGIRGWGGGRECVCICA